MIQIKSCFTRVSADRWLPNSCGEKPTITRNGLPGHLRCLGLRLGNQIKRTHASVVSDCGLHANIPLYGSPCPNARCTLKDRGGGVSRRSEELVRDVAAARAFW